MLVEQSAYVLHSRPYKETSALVTFFSAEQGKFNAIIRSVRGSKKAHLKAALLQPFQQLQLSWRQKTHQDLVSLNTIEAGDLRFPLHGETAVCGLYSNEMLYRLLYPNVSYDNLFQDYCDLLYYLAQLQFEEASVQQRKQAWALRWFELRLLNGLGHGFNLEQDCHHKAIEASQTYLFYPEYGFEALTDFDAKQTFLQIPGECLLQLRSLLTEDIDAIEITTPCLKTLRVLMRQSLQPYLGDRPIQSRLLLGRNQPQPDKLP